MKTKLQLALGLLVISTILFIINSILVYVNYTTYALICETIAVVTLLGAIGLFTYDFYTMDDAIASLIVYYNQLSINALHSGP